MSESRSLQPGAVATSLTETITLALAAVGQRYTPLRRARVEALEQAGRPLTVPEIVAATPSLPQSSAYRNVTTLIEAGVVRRVMGADDLGRFELDEQLSEHHHHLVCRGCGTVTDLHPSAELERVLSDVARSAAAMEGYKVLEHRLDLVGLCEACRTGSHA